MGFEHKYFFVSRRGAERGICGIVGKERLKIAHFDFEEGDNES